MFTWNILASGFAPIATRSEQVCSEQELNFAVRKGICGSNRTKYEIFGPERNAKPMVTACKTDLVEEHVQNFLDCCRSRKLPNGDVQAGHRSAQAAHAVNLSYLQRRRINFDPEREIVLSF